MTVEQLTTLRDLGTGIKPLSQATDSPDVMTALRRICCQ